MPRFDVPFTLPQVGGSRVVREIGRGERIADVQSELASRTLATSREHGIFTMNDGRRVIVEGGPNSISVPPDARRAIAHTHPGGNPIASEADHADLRSRGQQHAYIVSVPDGGRPAYTVRYDKEQTPDGHARASQAHFDSVAAHRAASCSVCRPAASPGAGAQPDAAPPADAPAQNPPRPADADEAYQRAMRTGGSRVGDVVYGVGGTPDSPVVHKFTPDGRYLGSTTTDRVPVAAEMGVSEQILRNQNPGMAARRMISAPDGRQYTVGQGGVLVDEGGTLRALSAAERASLPPAVQRQLMVRAAGPALALPDGVNGMGRNIGREMLNNWMDGVQLNMDADKRFGTGAAPPEPARAPAPPPRR